jgi:hypothetical protein
MVDWFLNLWHRFVDWVKGSGKKSEWIETHSGVSWLSSQGASKSIPSKSTTGKDETSGTCCCSLHQPRS